MSKRDRGAGGWLGKASHRHYGSRAPGQKEVLCKGPGVSTSLVGSQVVFTWPAQKAVRPTTDDQII